MGSIVHRGGLVWAGSHDVWMSPDSGVTWQSRTVGNLGNDYIDDINFFDRTNGIVCTHFGSVYLTHDQGLTWKRFQRFGSANSGIFLGNPNAIAIATGIGQTVDVTLDGGTTWSSSNLGTLVTCVKPLLGGSALALGGDQPSGRSIYKTTDYGATWQRQAGHIDFDSWSFDVDPCTPQYIYAVNEECTTPDDNKAALYISSDEGTTWTSTGLQAVRPYYCGSVALAAPGVFVQTTANGILRSTDLGVTWSPIGGPNAPFDSRLVCPITANIILAADNNGTIWRTFTSGGDSLQNVKPYVGLEISPFQLFVSDTLLNCDSPILRDVDFTLQLCSYPKIDTQYIGGPDSLDYVIVRPILDSLSGFDTATISFHPRGSGDRHGEYVIVLEDGTHIGVPLAGYGRGITFVEPLSASVTTDTIGDDVSVPIIMTGFPIRENLEVVLRYDPKLIYLGAFSNTGVPLDIPGEQWAGRSRLRITAGDLLLDTASGELRFQVYPDGDTCFKAVLDSLSILSPLAPCEYSIGAGVPIDICPPRGCGVMTITRFVRYHQPPRFTVFPNPSVGVVYLSSTQDVGEATMVLSDEHGTLLHLLSTTVRKGTTKLDLGTIPNGWYRLSLHSESADASCAVLVAR